MSRSKFIARLYEPSFVASDDKFPLSENNVHHARHVLRCRINDTLVVFNGIDNQDHQVTVHSIDKKQLTVAWQSSEANHRLPTRSIHLIQAVIQPQRLDWLLEKATELGVASIQLVTTDRGQYPIKADRLANKMQHWQQILISASGQSGRPNVPLLHTPISLQEALSNQEGPVAVADLGGAVTPSQWVGDTTECAVLIGPESGWSEDERAWFADQSYPVLDLGATTLRAETAGIKVVCALTG